MQASVEKMHEDALKVNEVKRLSGNPKFFRQTVDFVNKSRVQQVPWDDHNSKWQSSFSLPHSHSPLTQYLSCEGKVQLLEKLPIKEVADYYYNQAVKFSMIQDVVDPQDFHQRACFHQSDHVTGCLIIHPGVPAVPDPVRKPKKRFVGRSGGVESGTNTLAIIDDENVPLETVRGSDKLGAAKIGSDGRISSRRRAHGVACKIGALKDWNREDSCGHASSSEQSEHQEHAHSFQLQANTLTSHSRNQQAGGRAWGAVRGAKMTTIPGRILPVRPPCQHGSASQEPAQEPLDRSQSFQNFEKPARPAPPRETTKEEIASAMSFLHGRSGPAPLEAAPTKPLSKPSEKSKALAEATAERVAAKSLEQVVPKPSPHKTKQAAYMPLAAVGPQLLDRLQSVVTRGFLEANRISLRSSRK